MQAYIKRRSDFMTLPLVEVLDYDITIASIYDENSTFTLAGEHALNQGDFFFFQGQGWLIERSEPKAGMTSLTCVDLIRLFERPLVYEGSEDSIEGFIAASISDNYAEVEDTAYAMPYLTPVVLTSTPFISPEVDDGVYSLKSYISLVRRLKGVFVTFTPTRTSLNITIEAKEIPTRKIDFGDDAIRLLSESYSRKSIAKITAVEQTEGVVERVTDWYLLADGTVTDDPGDAERAEGDWTTITVKYTEDGVEAENKVLDQFAKNSYSHMIEFETMKQYQFFDRLQLRIRGRVLRSYISAVRKTSKSCMTTYKSGELRLDLTDVLREKM